MARVDADDRQPPRLQLVEQPGRELTAFETDPHSLGRVLRDDRMNAFRRRAALASPDGGSAIVDDAYRRLLEGYIQPDILLLHGCAPVRDNGSTDATSDGFRD